MSRPTIVVEVAFTTTNPLTVPGSWTDISSFVLEDGLSIRRGRPDELKAFSAATATVKLNNVDRRFEPLNTSSPYTPNVVPMRRIRIRATWSGTTYTLFGGFVTDWRPEYNSDAPTVTVQCTDFIGAYLARTSLSSLDIYNGDWDNAIVDPLTVSPAREMNARRLVVRAWHNGDYVLSSSRTLTVFGVNFDTGLADSEGITLTVDANSLAQSPATIISTKRWTTITSIDVFNGSSSLRAAEPKIQFTPATTYSPEFSGDAITTLMRGVGVAIGDRDFGNGASLLQEYAYGGSTINGIAQKIATTEDGVFYTARDGRVTFRGRSSRYNPATPTNTFDTSLVLPYASATLSYNDQNIYNIIRVTRDGGVMQEESDQTSIDRYFRRPLDRSTFHATDNDADGLAQWLLNFYANPQLRITSLRLNPELAPATLWPAVLAADINQRQRVVVRPKSGGSITQDVWLEGISIAVNKGEWNIDWSLSPGGDALYGFWALNSGALDSTTKAGY